MGVRRGGRDKRRAALSGVGDELDDEDRDWVWIAAALA